MKSAELKKNNVPMRSFSALGTAAAVLFVFFALFSLAVICLPAITQADISIIKSVQNAMSWASASIPIAAGGFLFYIMLLIPELLGAALLLTGKKFKALFIYLSIPFSAYIASSAVKAAVMRPRPPVSLQIEEHMSSTSYVSRHTFLTAALWGLFIYVLFKYIKNKQIKYAAAVFAVLWALFEGFSRIWLGVHHLTDVIGAYIFAALFVIFYIKLFDKSELSLMQNNSAAEIK